MSQAAKLWAIVPAAGIGQRFGAARPKQYSLIHGESVLSHSLKTLLSVPECQRIVLCLADDDEYWQNEPLASNKRILTCLGGATRAQSVMRGLEQLFTFAKSEDWVLVHDAARPCLHPESMDLLLSTMKTEMFGAILANRITDTIKRDNGSLGIKETVNRDDLWAAQTPQLFRIGTLLEALKFSDDQVTDEASAIERANGTVKLVENPYPNPKVTTKPDLLMAEFILQQQGRLS